MGLNLSILFAAGLASILLLWGAVQLLPKYLRRRGLDAVAAEHDGQTSKYDDFQLSKRLDNSGLPDGTMVGYSARLQRNGQTYFLCELVEAEAGHRMTSACGLIFKNRSDGEPLETPKLLENCDGNPISVEDYSNFILFRRLGTSFLSTAEWQELLQMMESREGCR
jgi:hypothetical protein